ncbi:hypothetical protein IFR04_004808 [Cadophora malorum]|uniref:Uncharacterized protein n=1 Tax=Cadophora malorum TaxID=108018 RepID=A0A8H7WC45_9HELO|nr:hypothetical protein IFR04_004808 [Cadophora malorum]
MNVFTQDASTALLNGLKDLWMSQIIESTQAVPEDDNDRQSLICGGVVELRRVLVFMSWES